MLFPSSCLVALSLVCTQATSTHIGIPAIGDKAIPSSNLGTPEKFAIPVTINNVATNGSIYDAADGASEADVLVAPAGIDHGDYVCLSMILQWNRWQVDTDTWIFNNRMTEKWLGVGETTGRLVTGERPTVFAVDHAGGPHIQLVIKMPNADQVWEEVYDGLVELKPANGKFCQHWIYS
ncbi:hypothetical protein MVEN_00789900 [Mycena venus]|uniref:Uncharacterized protein n=1 Tax=Mycena venus TaxID=2733690 RepID=A0A8H6YG63_9AGAR|nr:hypothetical protein MVEN_00789900 [Mycena venus]